MHSFIASANQILNNPYLNIGVGLILLASGVSSAMSDLGTLGGGEFGIHHGIILFSLIHVLKALTALFQHIERIDSTKNSDT